MGKKNIAALMCSLAIFIIIGGGLKGLRAQNNPAFLEKGMGEIINCYLRIRSRLAADSLEGIEGARTDMVNAAKRLQKTVTRAPGRDRRLERFRRKIGLSALITYSELLLLNPEIEVVRQRFRLISEPLVKYVELFGKPGNVPGELNLFYCMVYPGAWLQGSPDMGNPYYGTKNLKCGSKTKPKPPGEALNRPRRPFRRRRR